MSKQSAIGPLGADPRKVITIFLIDKHIVRPAEGVKPMTQNCGRRSTHGCHRGESRLMNRNFDRPAWPS
jgi:hypothetical protein